MLRVWAAQDNAVRGPTRDGGLLGDGGTKRHRQSLSSHHAPPERNLPENRLSFKTSHFATSFLLKSLFTLLPK